MQLTIVCIGIKEPGNIGAIARAMKNFGFERLLLVDCPVEHLSKTALDRASHAKDILQNAVKKDNTECLKEFDYVIGTTAKLGTFYNIPRVPLTPEQLGEKLSGLSLSKSNLKIAVVFGREDSGLTNNEVALCDFVVSIPASRQYFTLNVSHACSIMLYEIFKALNNYGGKNNENKSHVSVLYASKTEKETAFKLISEIINQLKFSTAEKKETQKKLWKKLIGKSFLTKKESTSMIGFFKKILGRR